MTLGNNDHTKQSDTGSPLLILTLRLSSLSIWETNYHQHATLIADLPFPGNMFIGIGLIRRVDFTLGSQLFTMVYTDTTKLHISVLNVTNGSSQVKPTAVHLRKTEVPPYSGCCLEARIARAGPADGDVLVTPITKHRLSIPHLVTSASDRNCIWAVNSLGHGTWNSFRN